MSTLFVFSNNASSLLASAITNTATVITVSAGTGALFPAIPAGHQAAITIEDVSGDIEVVYATGISGDSLTVVRGEEGTTALAFASGSRVEMRVTAAVLASFLQKTGGDTLSGTTTVSGVINLGSGGSIQGGEFTGYLRGGAGITTGQIQVPTGGGPPTAGGSLILTAGNLAANVPSGTALILSNMIVMWAGLSSAIPSGFVLCNGSNGTPDLRDKFIVGGGGSLAVSGTYAAVTDPTSAGTPSVTGAALTTANLPPHHHGNVIYGGGAGQVVGPTGTPSGGSYFFGGAGGGTAINWNTDNGPGTSSPLSFTGSALPTHTHTIETPPYRAVFFIMKT